ncbi:MAG TPA: tRNA pseudouridine(55) synthase TruB [Candidatus Nitrosotenuis sp.]|jgi:tRNA pseudouridine55 synthase|nr:tRNA pseudouridine(55) synthase TruB [Candidatus Nitrosotenuis sp.]
MDLPAGFLNVLKPPAMTSHDVVDFVRRLGSRKAGHLGTLDPAAAGVLPLALGWATRLIPFLPPARKVYRAEVTFGLETDTLDAEGKVLATRPLPADLGRRLQEACSTFLGTVMQAPPRVSALKVGGRRAYERARRGEDFELAPRPATYHRIEVLRLEGPRALLEVECEPGTYVRSLARDLGQLLGCGAILSFLVRTRSGPFGAGEALTLEELLEARRQGRLARCIWPCAELLARAGLPQVQTGASLETLPLQAGQAVRLVDASGRFCGVARVVSGRPPRLSDERVAPP